MTLMVSQDLQYAVYYESISVGQCWAWFKSMIYKSRFKSFHVIYDFDLNQFSGHDLGFWLKSFFNDFDLTWLLKIKIIILELQELIVVISLYSCRSLGLSWLGWLPVSMVSSDANLPTDEYTMQFYWNRAFTAVEFKLYLCLGLVGQQWFHCIVWHYVLLLFRDLLI